MNRFEKLGELNLNWPGQYKEQRIRLIASKTRYFDDDDFESGIDNILETHEGYPPKIAEIRRAIIQAKNLRIKGEQVPSYEDFKPGDIVYGERTFTPREALIEYERMILEHPEVFEKSPKPTPTSSKNELLHIYQLLLTKLYVSGLRKAIEYDRSIKLPEEQKELF